MKTYLEEAQDLYAQGNLKEAFEKYRVLLQVNPDIPEAWYGISLCIEDTNQKEYCLRKALELNPGYKEAESYLSLIKKSEGLKYIDENVVNGENKNIHDASLTQENGKEVKNGTVINQNENVNYVRAKESNDISISDSISNARINKLNVKAGNTSSKSLIIAISLLSVFLFGTLVVFIVTANKMAGELNLLRNENSYLASGYQKLNSNYSQLSETYKDLQVKYESVSEELERIKESSLIPPYISTKNREVTIAFTDTNNAVIKWTVPFDTFEQILELGFLYRYLSKDENTLVLRTDSGERFIVQDMSSYVVPNQFENVMPGLFASAGSNSEFIEQVWNIVGQLTTYSQEIGETPRFPLETLLAGGGDCEDTAILFASMILAAQTDWKVELVYMDIDNPTDPQTVNHVIVRISTGDEDYLIDTTQNEVMQPYKDGVDGWYFDAKK